MMRRVVYSSPFVPPEWIAAHGLLPVRAIPSCSSAGEGACPIAAGFEQMARSTGDAIVLTTTCDPMRRTADAIDADERVFLMNVPATWNNPASRRVYREELERLGRFLVRQGGTRLAMAEMVRVMMEHDRGRDAVRERYARGIGFQPMSSPRGIGFQPMFSAPSSSCPSCLRGSNPDIGWKPMPRVALVGGPLREEDRWIVETIERNGACVALDATETGERALPDSFSIEAVERDPLGELVRAYFDTIPDAFRRPLTILHHYLLREFERREIAAVVLVRALWCDLWHAQLAWLREAGGRPVIEVDLGGRDHDLERTRTRLEALVEVVR